MILEMDFLMNFSNYQNIKPGMNNNNFNKSFEALYAISMEMANQCIGQKDLEKRFEKLQEEYDEVIECFQFYQKCKDDKAANNDLNSELSDLFFVLLHIAHKRGLTAFELLHKASSKMLGRMNDPEYIAKN